MGTSHVDGEVGAAWGYHIVPLPIHATPEVRGRLPLIKHFPCSFTLLS